MTNQDTQKKICKQCDFKNAIRKGRANWICPRCGRQLMLEMVFMAEAGIEPKEYTEGEA